MEPVTEKHYTVKEVARMWNLSAIAVRRIFVDEPGVLVLGRREERRNRRAYRTLRIPESVLTRVHERLSNLERTA